MTKARWVAADREAEVCAAERDVESVGLGPPAFRELADGSVAVLDAAGRVHTVIGCASEIRRSPERSEALGTDASLTAFSQKRAA